MEDHHDINRILRETVLVHPLEQPNVYLIDKKSEGRLFIRPLGLDISADLFLTSIKVSEQIGLQPGAVSTLWLTNTITQLLSEVRPQSRH
jgi:hypothetical protein